MITLKGMTAFYANTPIVKSVDVAMRPGGCLAVLGRNGVGKTTLLKAIMGLTTRTTGEILLGEDRLDTRPTHERAIAGLGYVPQGRRILGKLTVRENIVLGTFARSDGNSAIPPRCLEMFPYLADNLDRRAGLLSGGQQQQLAIARALATDPKVLLLDEPTEGIQPNIVAEIARSLIRLNREFGITLILTEQHVAMAKRIATDFIVMDTGRIVESGPIDALSQEMLEQHLTI